jgi:signal transduction histidine kinase
MSRRLLAGFIAITLVVLVGLLVPLGITYAARQIERTKAATERDAVALASLASTALEQDRLDPTTEALARKYATDNGARIVITDRRGMALLDTDPPFEGQRDFSTRPEFAAALDGLVGSGQRNSATLGAGFVYVAVPAASGGEVHGAVRITYPTESVDARVRRNWLRLGVVGLITLAGAAAAGIVIARWVTKPIRSLHDSAVALGSGDLTARVPEGEGPPEIRDLATAFNRTADRLSDLIASQEAFVADASHELRTPLTALRLRLETLQDEVPPAAAEDLDAAIAETERLDRLVQGLLALARAEQLDPTDHRQPLVVEPVLAERRATWQPFADERGIHLEVDAASDLAVLATPDRVVQVLDNLVANALDASPDGATVRLTAEVTARGVALHVLDEGTGMPLAERERAFDRYWRSDTTRANFGGNGIGLAIVAKLVRADGGSVTLDEADGGGVDAVVVLTAAEVNGSH